MFNINIYSNYEVIRSVDTCYKTYDSDDPDYFKKEQFKEELLLSGSELIKHLKSIYDKYCICVTFGIDGDSLYIKIENFDASDGTGTDYEYRIKEIRQYGES